MYVRLYMHVIKNNKSYRRECLTALQISKYEPIKSYGFTQRALKGVNEMTLVLLNDVDVSCMLHLFFVHVRAIMELQRTSRIGKLHSETKETTKRRTIRKR